MSISIRWLDHTAIAVHSIESALPLYRDVLGGDPQELSVREDKGFAALLLRFPGGGGIELIEPRGADSFVQAFLERRGEGVHHITYMVEDLATAIAEAKAAGLRVVGEDFREPSWQEAFISPRDAHGTIIQLAQSNLDLAGRVDLWPADAYRVQERGGS